MPRDCAAEVIAEPGAGEAVLGRALPALLTLIAADIAGAAEWQLQATAEYAIIAVPFPVLRHEEFLKPLTPATQPDIRQLHYHASGK